MFNKKKMTALAVATMSLGVIAVSGAFAEEAETSAQTEAAAVETVAAAETTNEIPTAKLADILDFKAGELTKEGWASEFLNLKFTPGDNFYMGVDENEVLNEYHKRNGEENMAGYNEMVALSQDGKSYVQLMIEVNPNGETADVILNRFIEQEDLKKTTEEREDTIGDMDFLTTTGEGDAGRYMIGVYADDTKAVALKMKYENAKSKRDMTKAFEVIEEKVEAETEIATEEATEAAQ